MADQNCCEIEDLRKKFDLKSGDKFALISCMTGGEEGCCTTGETSLCCLTLVHTKQLKGMVNNALGPMLSMIK